MPSTYAHEPDSRALEAITRCISALQSSTVQSCAALFNTHDGCKHSALSSHARVRRVRREAGEAHLSSSASDSPPSMRRAATMHPNGWLKAARPAPVSEVSAPPSPLSRHAAHLESSASRTWMRLAEEEVGAKECALRRGIDLNAPDMRHGKTRHAQFAQSCVYGSFGSSQEEGDSVKVDPDSRGIHLPCFCTCGTLHSAFHASSRETAARGVSPSPATLSHQQRQPPSLPPSWAQAASVGARQGSDSHPLELNLSAEIRRERRRCTFSLSVSKETATSRVSRTDATLSADDVCNALGSKFAQVTSRRHRSHLAQEWKPSSREQHGGSWLTRWMMPQGGEVPLASLPPEAARKCTSASSMGSSRSPPSVTVAVAHSGRSVASCDTEALQPSVRYAGACVSLPNSSASVSSCSSYSVPFVERGGRHRTCRMTTMRRGDRKEDGRLEVNGNGGAKAPSHTAPAATVAATAGHVVHNTRQRPSDALYDSSPLPRAPQQEEAERLWLSPSMAALDDESPWPLIISSGTNPSCDSTVGPTRRTPPRLARAPRSSANTRLLSATSLLWLQRHPADRGTDAAKGISVQPTLDRTQRAPSETLAPADCASSQLDASTPSGLERCSLPMASAPLLDASVDACAANEASPAPFTSRSSRLSSPSAADAAAVGGAHVVSVAASPGPTRRGKSSSAWCTEACCTSAAPSCALAPAPTHIAISAKVDLSLADAATTLPDVLSGPATTSTCAEREQHPRPPPLSSWPLESSPVADVQRMGGVPPRSLSPCNTSEEGSASGRRGDTPPAPPARAGNSLYHLPRREPSINQDNSKVQSSAENRTASLTSAGTDPRDVARPVESAAGVAEGAAGVRTGRLGRGEEETLSHAVERQYVGPQRELIDTADGPVTRARGMEGYVGRDEPTCAIGDISGSLLGEGGQERQRLQPHPQQQQQRRYLMYVSPTTSSASPLNQDGVAAAATRRREFGIPLSAPLAVSPMKRFPPLGHHGNDSLCVSSGCGAHASLGVSANASRNELHEGTDRGGSRCLHSSPATLEQGKRGVSETEATAATVVVPGHSWLPLYRPSVAEADDGERDIANESSLTAVPRHRGELPSLARNPMVVASFLGTRDDAVRLASPARSHSDVTVMPKSEEGMSLCLCGGGERRASHSRGEDSGSGSPYNSTEAHRPRRHRAHSASMAHSSATSVLNTSQFQFDALRSVASDFDWVSEDYAAQQQRQRYADGGGPLAVPLPIDAAETEPLPALVTCGSSSGSVFGSQASAVLPPTGGIAAAENLNHIDSPRQRRHMDGFASSLELPRYTPSSSGSPHQTTQHSCHIPVPDSSPTNSTGSPYMDSFASLEHTPLSQSIISAAAMESSVAECGAPMMSSFFAYDHTADASLAAAAVRGVEEAREDATDDVCAAEGPVLWVHGKAEVHEAEEDADRESCLPAEGPSSSGSRSSGPLFCAAPSAARTSADVRAETDHATLLTSATKSVVAAYSHSFLRGSGLHSNSVFDAGRRAHTSHAAISVSNRRSMKANGSLSTDLGVGEEPNNSNDDRVDNSLDDVPTLRDQYVPCPAPVLSVGGGNAYSRASSAPAPPPPPPRLLCEPQPQPQQQRVTFLLPSFLTGRGNAEDQVAAMQSRASGQETGGSRVEAREGSWCGVAADSSPPALSTNAASPVQAMPRLPRERPFGVRQEGQPALDAVPLTHHYQPLQQWQPSKQVQGDGDTRSSTLQMELCSDFFPRGSRPHCGSVNAQPLDTDDGTDGRGTTRDGLEGEPGMIVGSGGDTGEGRGERVASAPPSVRSHEGSRGDSAATRSAAGDSCDDRSSRSAYPSIDATVPTVAGKAPGHYPPASRQGTRTPTRAVLSKPPLKYGANHPALCNGPHRSSTASFSDGDSAVAPKEASSLLGWQEAMTLTDDAGGCAAEATAFDADDDEGGGYCSHGYESDSVYV
ncbi:hypothetical protein LSCM1_04421 [Leishmania martiniquensis]|uniref:Uncharacterized protein n=1 Tax=Leishmania martiniquensis TaxID=1580590 RepID=A0A836GF08_9TRYP|nr:hypothetical protein LSCM1_04421 [Leishmania martiniquensis]